MNTALDEDYSSTAVLHALDEAGEDLDLLHDKLAAIPGKSPNKATALTMCGDALYKRYNDEGDEEDLDNCIRAYDLALESASTNLAGYPKLLVSAATAYHDRFTLTHSNPDIDCAISLFDVSLTARPESHPQYPRLLASAATAYHGRFDLTQSHADIDRAFFLFDASIKATSDTDSQLPSTLVRFGGSLQARFLNFKDHADLLWAIEIMRKAVELTSDSNLNLPSRLSNLTNLLQRLFERSGDIAIISEAIDLQQKAVQLTRDGDPKLPTWIEYLADALLLRFRHFRDTADISKAVELYDQVVKFFPPSDIDYPLKMSSLGVALRYRFERFGNVQDLSRAIESQQMAVNLGDEDPELPRLLDNLASSLSSRFEHFGDVTDISTAIQLQRKAVERCEDDDPDLDVRLTNLAGLLQTRHEHSGDLAELEEAMVFQKKALELHPGTHPDLRIWLSNLGTMFCTRFERFRGDVKDISQAIALLQKAVHLTPSSHPELGVALTNLGASLLKRFERLRDIADISYAIETLQDAEKSTPKEDPALPSRLSNLGEAFNARFDHNGGLDDLGQAIKLTERAVQLTPTGYSNRPLWLHNMGSFFIKRFERSREDTDINKAVNSFQEALGLLPGDHAFLPTLLAGLGDALRERFLHSGDVADISRAIEEQERSIQLTRAGHPNSRSLIYKLGNSFEARFKHLGDVEDIKSAISNYRQATANEHGAPLHRLATARAWADACQRYLDDPSQLLEAYGIAIDLISQVAGLEQTIELRQTNLLQTSDLACSAAAAAFTHGRPELALEWLEQGRCIVWSQLNQLRTSMDDLRTRHPDLADRLQELSFALERAGSRPKSELAMEKLGRKAVLIKKVELEEEAANHINIADEWNKLLGQIRRIPEFYNFLLPRTSSEILRSLGVNGAVIMINVHETRCDAVALAPNHNKPIHISLPDFTHPQAVDLRRELLVHLWSAGKRMREAEPVEPQPERGGHPVDPQARSRNRVANLLGKLWRNVVKPIFDAIGYQTLEPRSDRRRIWWCSTGPLAFLPIHAAGIYEKGGACVFDYAISSYIPTIGTLIDKTKGTSRTMAGNRLLLISQAEAESLPRIPGADQETKMLKKLMKKSGVKSLRIAGIAATTANVRKEMASYGSIHLACHAKQNVKKPLESGFYLLNETLLLSEIIKQHNLNGDLAFLSACQTSTGDEQLSEEAFHLAGGMLAAGYRSVVATMWSMSDAYGAETAETFYSCLCKNHGVLGRRSSMENEPHLPFTTPFSASEKRLVTQTGVS